MSTEHQHYSLAYQQSAIADFARQHRFNIVKTYADPAKSGLLLKNRPGLMALLNDVVSPDCLFRAVLVYDVSRWGRFQDTDEAAHYEFLCRRNGIAVHYCAEQFTNDEALPNAILKLVKRNMAAEYSRELSSKVYQALRRIAEPGFHAGGMAGYGYRRMLVDVDGKPLRLLQKGEWKPLLFSGHVTLVLGPPEEVETVRSIYRMLLEEGMNLSQIAAELNNRSDGSGRLWRLETVKGVLTHPKYAGMAVWGRTDFKLQRKWMRVPSDRWIVRPGAVPAIVDAETFLRAQQVYRDRIHPAARRIPDKKMLDALRMLWKKTGRLDANLISSGHGMPSVSSYRGHFGSLRKAYHLIGYPRSQSEVSKGRLATRRRKMRLRRKIVQQLQRMFPGRVERSQYEGYVRCPDLNLDVAITLCSMIAFDKSTIWSLYPRSAQRHTMTLLCLLNRGNDRVESLHLFPRLTTNASKIRSGDSILGQGLTIRSLRDFYRTVLRAYQELPEAERGYQPELLRGAPQIARYLNKSCATVLNWTRKGKLPVISKTRPVTVSRAELDEWLQAGKSK